MAEATGVFSIPASTPFLEALGRGLLDEAGGEPLALSGMTVLLPTRRACRAFADVLLRLGDGRPMLLPRLRPLGDVDEDEAAFEPEAEADELALPPAISPLRRRLLLAQLVRRARPDADISQAVLLAEELTRLLDELQREDLELEALEGIAPESFARHWQETLKFLQVLAAPWRGLLAAEKALDPVARRNRLLRRLAERWRARPPDARVVAAGSTGSIPATAALLQAIAALPRGAVVLPGLDRVLDDESWQALPPGHPQFGLKQLLDGFGLPRRAVRDWPGAGTPSARVGLIAEALRPAASTERWRQLGPVAPQALEGLARIDCAGPKEEAATVALLLRRTLERPGATAALVTPDRTLARRVAVELGRWGIEVDDSAGQPLEATPPGTFLRLVATAFGERLAPVALLAMLKHPLCRGGRPAAAFNADVRRLDEALRGPRPAPGFEGLRRSVEKDRRLAGFVDALSDAARPLTALLSAGEADLAALVAAHVAFAERLASDADGEVLLWRGDAGEAAARFISELHAAAAGLPAVRTAHFAELLRHLMAGRPVRPRWGRHPRLFIWGPLEARLQHADLIVLGGLNEGTWPADALADPWLSRPMRRRVGLPAPERRIGLAAHDFAQAAAAPEVVLTRARRQEGAPTVPSRWLSRLDAVLGAAGLTLPEAAARDLAAWQEALDRPEAYRPATAPTPTPPVAARPRRLSVTRIETWMRDPYAIYARYVLDLKPLDRLDADPGAAERGIAVHAALDRFVREYPEALPPEPLPRLLAIGEEAFAEWLTRPGIRAFWWPRFERIADWFLAQERARRGYARPLASEVEGRLTLPGPAGEFELTALADRIDRLADGRLAIVDYKTGAPPSEAEVKRGWSPQLPLEAAIARAGGFAGIEAAAVGELAHWRLGGGRVAGEARSFRADPGELADEALVRLAELVRRFDDPATAYLARPRPTLAPRFGDYEHLARIREWATAEAET